MKIIFVVAFMPIWACGFLYGIAASFFRAGAEIAYESINKFLE